MPRSHKSKRENREEAPRLPEAGPGPTPGKAEGADGPFRGYPGEVGPGPTPGNAEGEPDHVNENLMHEM